MEITAGYSRTAARYIDRSLTPELVMSGVERSVDHSTKVQAGN